MINYFFHPVSDGKDYSNPCPYNKIQPATFGPTSGNFKAYLYAHYKSCLEFPRGQFQV